MGGQRDAADSEPASIARELARARRHGRRQRRFSDRVVDTYTVVLAFAVFVPALSFLSPAEGSTPPTQFAAERGAAAVGVLVALVIGLGVRSGSLGGPLLFSAADVSVLLMAPVPHLRLVAARLRRVLVVAVAVGALCAAVGAGAVASQLAIAPGVLVAGSAVAGGLAAAAGFGTALVAARFRVDPRDGLLIAVGLLGLAAVDLMVGAGWWPGSWIGSWATIGIAPSPARLTAGVLIALGTVVVGFTFRADIDLARVGRRSLSVSHTLAGIVLQDVRGLLVAMHSRPDELPRLRSWADTPPPRRWQSWRRGWHGLLRTSTTRVIRVVALSVIAGVTVAASRAIPAAAAVAVMAMYFVALEAADPIGQEVDRPTRRSSYPLSAPMLYARLAGPSIVVMVIAHLLASIAAAIVGGGTTGLVIAVLAPPGALASVASAVFAFARGKPDIYLNLRFATDPTGLAIIVHHVRPALGAGSALFAAAIVTHSGLPLASTAAFSLVPLGAAALAAVGVLWASWGQS